MSRDGTAEIPSRGPKHGSLLRRLTYVQNRPIAFDAALRLALVALVALLVFVLLPAAVAAQAASSV